MFSGYFWYWIKILSFTTFLNKSFHSGFSLNCLKFINKITSLTADFAAFWQISVKSAPEKPSVIFAKKLRSTSFEIGVFLRFALRTPNLDG
jgi:hypothetical protein